MNSTTVTSSFRRFIVGDIGIAGHKDIHDAPRGRQAATRAHQPQSHIENYYSPSIEWRPKSVMIDVCHPRELAAQAEPLIDQVYESTFEGAITT